MLALTAWTLLALFMATYVGYPLVMIGLASLFSKRSWHQGQLRPVAPSLSVAVVICAHNEERHLAAKLDSVLAAARALSGGVRIIVADDGSTDTTLAIAQQFEQDGVEVLALPRGGKAAALNRATAFVREDVIVLTDADPLFQADTLVQLLAPFADPKIGALAGVVEMVRSKNGGGLAAAGHLFRQYENALRKAEDRVFGTISADGGLYALRARLMPQVPPDGTDDFFISTAAPAAGLRIAFAPYAIVTEHPTGSESRDLRRRIRITVRGLTSLGHRRALLNPLKYGGYAFGLAMHKIARRMAPLVLVPLAFLAPILATGGSAFWFAITIGLVVALALAIAAWLTKGRLPKVLKVPYLLGLHLFGLGAGVILFLGGKRFVVWTPEKASGA